MPAAIDPHKVENWLWLAYSTRMCESVLEAEQVLKDALNFHPREAHFHYLLCSYAALQHRGRQGQTRHRDLA